MMNDLQWFVRYPVALGLLVLFSYGLLRGGELGAAAWRMSRENVRVSREAMCLAAELAVVRQELEVERQLWIGLRATHLDEVPS